MPDVIVDLVSAVRDSSPPDFFPSGGGTLPPGFLVSKVEFAKGRTVYLDPRQPMAGIWRAMLGTANKWTLPIYVEADQLTGVVTRVNPTNVARVLEVTPTDGGRFRVRLDSSAARHVVGDASDAERELFAFLKKAVGDPRQVVVAADPERRIIHYAAWADHEVPADDVLGPPRDEETILKEVSVASEFFFEEFARQLLKEKCALPAVAGDCLPFQYPDDQCFATAHRICQLLSAHGHHPAKVWLHGDLEFDTDNREDCVQKWDFHVAAVLRDRETTERSTLVVIDPVVFPERGFGRLHEWTGLVRGHDDVLVVTSARRYRQEGPGNGISEPRNATAKHLAEARDALRLRAANRAAPPPYDHCRRGR